MNPAELLRRLRRLTVRRGLHFETTQGRNHTKVMLGIRRSVMGRHTADRKTGTLRGILRQLGLRPEDIEDN